MRQYANYANCTPIITLPLASLLARRNNPERRTACVFLARCCCRRRPAFLGHLAPSAAILLLGQCTRGNRVHDALVCQLAAPDELLGEPTAIQSLRVGVYRVRNDLCFRGKEEKLLDEVVDYLISNQFEVKRRKLTIDAAV